MAAWDSLLDGIFGLLVSRFQDARTGMIYSYDLAERDAALPTSDEVRQSLPSAPGWGSGIEDCAMNGGLLLAALADARRGHAASCVFRALDHLMSAATDRGFVPRGVLPDGVTHYANTSGDQTNMLVYGICRYLRSGLASAGDARRAGGMTVAFGIARSADEVGEILQQLSEMHIARWRQRHETSVFVVPQERAWLHAACQALHRQGQLYVFRLSLDGAPVSIGFYSLARRRLTNYMVSFDEAYRRFGPVHPMVMMAIEDTRARGLADVHDFGRGSEEYKLRWARTSQPLARALVARRSPAGRAAFWWATRAQPFIWEHYRAATLLRELRRRLRARKSGGRDVES